MPPTANAVFGARLPVAERYAEFLATAGVERGLLGPREGARLWERHLVNSAVLVELLPGTGDVIDVGSGAGLPGIPLAILRPELSVTLVEPMQRRTAFLEECVSLLELENVSVVRGRAEDLAGEIAADVVVARAVAPLDRLLRWTLPLVRPGGQVLAIKGAKVAEELTALGLSTEPGRQVPRRALRTLGVETVELVCVGDEIVDPPATVVRATRSGR
ncbi:MAG: 16S rRNA (guanine(527)-N(7))-methyltransferase RsmG [Streptosporangiales bacterium]|nr:16S rRNA (guanine(527)-N(7))-methyltransferase RsmG [Streptosporangiales bacterium]